MNQHPAHRTPHLSTQFQQPFAQGPNLRPPSRIIGVGIGTSDAINTLRQQIFHLVSDLARLPWVHHALGRRLGQSQAGRRPSAGWHRCRNCPADGQSPPPWACKKYSGTANIALWYSPTKKPPWVLRTLPRQQAYSTGGFSCLEKRELSE